MLNVFGRTKDISWYGQGKSELDELVERIAKNKQNRSISKDPAPELGLFYRSDHLEFMKVGVPGLFLAMGFEHVEKGKEWLVKRNEEWTRSCYHKPQDVVYLEGDWKWELSGAVEDLLLMYEMCEELCSMKGEELPKWYSSAEFQRPEDEKK
eukprot:TRINITY_DN5896_c0_g2_i1.p1 TRINITY_DN5896_c0_g2~~TRINITY_DN5896_c0_g2_i1.p1  ORF type:complete len:152 (-),score=47.50 TRINITY_DN5896_c0_g2_i1:9-464(-)